MILLAIKFICSYKRCFLSRPKGGNMETKKPGRPLGSGYMKPNRLKAYLAMVGMTLKDFCYIIEYEKAYVTSVVTGRLRPSYRLIRKIKLYTGGEVDLEHLLKKKEPDIKREDEETQKAA